MEVLKFSELVEGWFLRRMNRFLAEAEVNGRVVPVHLWESGRAGELLVEGARVLLLPKKTPKTDYTLVAVERKPYGWIFLNPGYHSAVAEKLLVSGALPELRDVEGYGREVKIGSSRIDFVLVYPDGAVPLEVKGCTLFVNDVALFPDAPTDRGTRHVRELSRFERSVVMFLVMSEKVRVLSFHHQNDPNFVHTLTSNLHRIHVMAPTFSFDGKVLHHVRRIPFLFPVTDESHFVLNVLKEAEERYNDSFSPEVNAFVNGLLYGEKNRFWVVFWGYLCVSCGLFDYFEDFSLLLDEIGIRSRPVGYRAFGNTYVVEYDII